LKLKIDYIILTSVIILCALSQSNGQTTFDARTKYYYIFGVVRAIEWKNIDDLDSIEVTILETHPDVYDIVKTIKREHDIHFKPFKIKHCNSIEQLTPTQVLYIDDDFQFDIDSVVNAIRNDETLLITVNSELHKTMVNFIELEGRYRFEINEQMILDHNMTVSTFVLELATRTQADWEALFKESETELEEHKKIIEDQKTQVTELQEEIQSQKEELANQEKEINEKQIEIQNKEKVLNDLQDKIQTKQATLDDKSKEIENREDEISKVNNEIEFMRNTISDQKAEVDQLFDQGEKLKEELTQSTLQINRQKTIILLIIVLLVFFISFVIVIIRVMRNRKIVTQQLGEKNRAINKQKEEIQAQAEHLSRVNKELQKLSIVASGSDNAIFIFDTSGELEWVNEGFTRLLGYTKEEYIAERGSNIRNLSENKKINDLIEKCITQKKSVTYESINHSKSDEKIWLQTTLTPIFQNNRLDKLVAVDTNVTKIKFAETEITTQKKELEKAFKQNTKQQTKLTIAFKKIEDQNKELEKAYEKIKETTRIKEVFLANTSHEIRTPLNAIIGFTNLLLRKPIGESIDNKDSQYLSNIKNSGDNLLVIINDILDFSKIEAGKLTIEKTNFNIREIAQTVISTLQMKASENDINLVLNMEKQIPEFLIGDPVRLNQVIMNLAGNAIKFTKPKGHVSVSIELENETADLADLVFKVNDDGIGIPQDKLETIFDSFTQAESDTTRKYGGTGLGLAIVKRLIELQHGEIFAESELNQGTTFTFKLSYQKGEKKEPSKTVEFDYHLGECHPKDITILIAEDNQINQQLAIDTIKAWNKDIEIEIVESGIMAIDKLKEKDFNLIFMDIQMPEMDGYETTKAIREQLPVPKSRIPIIAMSAHTMLEEKNKSIDSGMNDYIIKPFNPDELYYKIKLFTCKYVADALLKDLPVDVAAFDCRCQEQPANDILSENYAESFEFNYIDLSFLTKIYKDDTKKIQKIIKMYISSVPDDLQEMKEGVENKNWKLLKGKAHTLKPKMSYLGLQKLHEHTKQIEKWSAEKIKLKNINRLIDEMVLEWKKAEKELYEFLDIVHF